MENEIYEALVLASKYLDLSDDLKTQDLVYRTPAQGLRMAADSLEQKDADIQKIRQVIKKYKEGICTATSAEQK